MILVFLTQKTIYTATNLIIMLYSLENGFVIKSYKLALVFRLSRDKKDYFKNFTRFYEIA